MDLSKAFEILHVDPELNSPEEVMSACGLILRTEEMDSAMRDTLRACFECGPIWDGDLPSKTGRDSLVELGFVQGVVVSGEEGYNACTYMGARAYRLLKARGPRLKQVSSRG
jgi:hypothetical protein